MAALGIVQHPDPILAGHALPFELPAEAAAAQVAFERLRGIADRVLAVHPSRKGLGVAGPQIGIERRIAIFRPWGGGGDVCLLNAEIISTSDNADVRYEGCLSLFDVRGAVRRPLAVTIHAQDFDGAPWERTYVNAAARLVCHELDHLDGRLYIDRMDGMAPISAEEYRRLPDTDWNYWRQRERKRKPR